MGAPNTLLCYNTKELMWTCHSGRACWYWKGILSLGVNIDYVYRQSLWLQGHVVFIEV